MWKEPECYKTKAKSCSVHGIVFAPVDFLFTDSMPRMVFTTFQVSYHPLLCIFIVPSISKHWCLLATSFPFGVLFAAPKVSPEMFGCGRLPKPFSLSLITAVNPTFRIADNIPASRRSLQFRPCNFVVYRTSTPLQVFDQMPP
ncbi:uncharacterized protein LOC112090687 isoform X2 [Morus notabilis]|uniref:uncharacterized protein LOC112090687 isoform X2 n=1 Tax=Morus notabilis TaxID=981085 RepID=UPI000CED029A|nr:uncharacterized protein LOC112090687 isoform X2 [Morus notabilis]XP_024018367.1 uncharacterized protein LOC112090687 isoform X2 [Morus notabilis]